MVNLKSNTSKLASVFGLLMLCFLIIASALPKEKYGTLSVQLRLKGRLLDKNGMVTILKDGTEHKFTITDKNGHLDVELLTGRYEVYAAFESLTSKKQTVEIARNKTVHIDLELMVLDLEKDLTESDTISTDTTTSSSPPPTLVNEEAETADYGYHAPPELARKEKLSEGSTSSDIGLLRSYRTKDMRSEAAPAMMMEYSGETGYPHSGSGDINAAAGTLTAGELNDFNKFELWTDISEGTLGAYAEQWQIHPKERYTFLLTNNESGAVVDAKVTLRNAENEVVWTAKSNNAGRVDLWANLHHEGTDDDLTVEIEYAGSSFTAEKPIKFDEGVNHLELPVGCYNPIQMDIAFVVDATGSMADEIAYLKMELKDVITAVKGENNELDIRTSSVFYRDHTDEYVTVKSDFSDDINVTNGFINEQGAKGGGDMPEAVDEALAEAVNTLKWSDEARAKLLFLVLDAPPHSDEESVKRVNEAITKAAEMGIRIIPIVGSGADKGTEYLMRSAALATNGTYVFLTDHSGVGGAHMAPTTDEYDVTYLNELMKEIINRFAESTSCHNDEPQNVKPELVLIDNVKGQEKSYNPKTETYVKLELQNDVLAAKDEVNHISKKDKEKINEMAKDSVENKAIYSLFPNPTSGNLNVFTSKVHERIIMLDMSGKLLREFNTNSRNQFAIDVSDYPPGMYFIGFYKEDNLHTERFVLRK